MGVLIIRAHYVGSILGPVNSHVVPLGAVADWASG